MSRFPQKIAFAGKMGSGKSTAAAILVSKGFSKLSFADPLYNILYFAQDQIGKPHEKDRWFLQNVGSWARQNDKDVFVNLLIEASKGCKFAVVDDLRYENELNALKQDGWYCVKIIKPSSAAFVLGTGDARHESELGLEAVADEKWDRIILNDGTLDDLEKVIQSLGNNDQ